MNREATFYHFIILIFFVFIACTIVSCSSSRNTAKRPISYSRQKTKQPRWNTTTSPTTTYYIKKHSTRKRHNP